MKIPFWKTKYLRIGSLLQIHYGEFERDHAMNLDTKGPSGVPHCVSALINGRDWLWTRVNWEVIWMKNCRWYNSWTQRRINKSSSSHNFSFLLAFMASWNKLSMRSANWNHVTWVGKVELKNPLKTNNLKTLKSTNKVSSYYHSHIDPSSISLVGMYNCGIGKNSNKRMHPSITGLSLLVVTGFDILWSWTWWY